MDNTISKTNIKGEVITKLRDEQFLYFADNSSLGIVLIQRGILKYFNPKFAEIFGYTEDEVSNWNKREFYKIVHPEDLSKLVQNFKIEDNKTASVQFRGIRKDGQIIPIKNYVCTVKYNDINAYLSTYNPLNNPNKINLVHLKDNELDLVQIICQGILDKIASGKKLNYFEKIAGEVLNQIYKIKTYRFFRKN